MRPDCSDGLDLVALAARSLAEELRQSLAAQARLADELGAVAAVRESRQAIVAMQAFDLIIQQNQSIADALDLLARAASAWRDDSGASLADLPRALVDAITLGGMQHRLAARFGLSAEAPGTVASGDGEPEIELF